MIAKQAGKLIVFAFVITIILSTLLKHRGSYENGFLPLTLHTLFIGILPIIISVLAGRVFLQTNRNEAIFLCCGMLIFSFGSIVTGIWSFLSVSKDRIAILYSICLFASSVCHIHASLMLKSTQVMRPKKHWLLFAVSLLCVLFMLLIIATFKQATPILGSGAQIRTVLIWISIVLYFYAFFIFYQQYQDQKEDFHFWFSFALFLFSLGIFCAFTTSDIDTLQGWCGRFAQYLGAIFAYFAMLQVFRIGDADQSSGSETIDDSQKEPLLPNGNTFIDTIFEALPEPVYLKNCDGTFIAGNTALSLAIGIPIHNIIGKSEIEFLYDHRKAQQIMDHDHSVINSGCAQVFEEMIPTPMGDRFFLNSKAPWLDKTGNVIGIIGVLQDITERKEMEIRISRHAEDLREKNQQITDFFVNISHDFKTPLTIIMLCIDLLEDHVCTKKNIAVMKQNCYRLGRLITNLLDLAKIDAGHLEPNWEYFDIIQQVTCLVESVSQYIEKKNLKITFHFSHKTRYICSDSFITERIIINLLSNAIKYTNCGGLISVSCFISSQRIHFSVKDTGQGIPDHKKDIIFNRYAQVNSASNRSTEEYGIGLALTKSLVELLGGRIWFESKEGFGSEFFVELPILNFSQKFKTIECTQLQDNKRIQMELSDLTN